MPKIYLDQNVFDASLDRIRRIFDEFSRVGVSTSGGKDSTVVFNLTMMVAKERGRLPLDVFWLDQEAEWQTVVDYTRKIMNRPDVRPWWFQGPFRMSNSTTTNGDAWLYCWRDGDKWIRPKEPNSIHVNVIGADRFHDMFGAFFAHYFNDTPNLAMLNGVRCEESPTRFLGLTGGACYKDITWGALQNKKLQHFAFSPIYDWTTKDIWKAIHSNGWEYCNIYNLMFQHGIPWKSMRVSNVNHEQSLGSLTYMQEVDPVTWDAVVERFGSANAVSKAWECYSCPSKLPPMFTSWREYRDYLLVHITHPTDQPGFRKRFEAIDRNFMIDVPYIEHALMQTCIGMILVNDLDNVRLDQIQAGNPKWRKRKKDERARAVRGG